MLKSPAATASLSLVADTPVSSITLGTIVFFNVILRFSAAFSKESFSWRSSPSIISTSVKPLACKSSIKPYTSFTTYGADPVTAAICRTLFSKETTLLFDWDPSVVYCIKRVFPDSSADSRAFPWIAISSCAVVNGWWAPNATTALVTLFAAFLLCILSSNLALLAAKSSSVSVNPDLPEIRFFTWLGSALRTSDEGPLKSIVGLNCGELANGCASPVPPLNPWSFPLTIASIMGWNWGSCATSFGITASPGVSTAGTVSLFPLPGTYVVPFASFFGALPIAPVAIIPGFALAKFAAANVALIYACLSAFTAEVSSTNDCVSFVCAWLRDAATVAASSCSLFKYWVLCPRTFVFPPSFKNPLRIARNSLTIFAAPFASKPNVIKSAGPIIPTSVVATTINFFVPSLRPLNFSNIPAIDFTIGVTASKNVLPIGAIVSFNVSTASLKFVPTAFSIVFNSRSDIIASSSTSILESSRTRLAWVPSFVTFWNNVDKRENWNLPNSCSMARARLSGSSVSNACANWITVFFMSPWFPSTISLMLTPRPASILDAFSDGLIKDARPDLSALAPSDALIPPSFIAVRKNARSSTSPPSCFTTGPAFGTAIVKSSIDTIVWFSTELRKSIFFARSSAAIPNALVKEIVVSSACSCSTLPKTASLVACATCAVSAAPVCPIAAADAAISIVLLTATPYFVNSSASFWTSDKALFVWSEVVNISP